MSPEEYGRMKEIFEQVIELPKSVHEVHIEKLCHGDSLLAKNVRELLRFHNPDAAENEAQTVEGRSPGNANAGMSGVYQRVLDRNWSARFRAVWLQVKYVWRANSYRTRVLTASLFLSLLVSVLGAIILGAWKYHAIETWGGELARMSSLVATAMRHWTEMHISKVETIARSREVRRISFSIDESAQEAPEDDLQPNPVSGSYLEDLLQSGLGESVGYVLWSANGQILSSSFDEPELAMKCSALDPNDLVKVFNGSSVLHLPRCANESEGSASKQTKLAWIIVPISDKAGQIRVALGVSQSDMTSQFVELNRGFDFGNSGEVISFDPLGVALSQHRMTSNRVRWFEIGNRLQAERGKEEAHPDEPRSLGDVPGETFSSETQMPLLEPVSKAVNGGEGTELDPFLDFQGKECIAAYRWIADLNFGILVKLDYDEATHSLGWFHRMLTACYCVTGLWICAMVVSAYFDRKATKSGLSTGDILGSYQLGEQIGCGGMGVVFKAKHLLLERFAAVKVLMADSHDHQSRKRFDREVRLLARLCSPHTVSVFDYGHTKFGEPYFAMELLCGITLDQLVAREGPQPVQRVLRLIAQAAESLAEAHGMGLVHRDIKPQNLMLTQERHGSDWLVVFDFGLAKAKTGETGLYNTDQTVWVGTPLYMAPERIRSPYLAEPASDLFSLGAVAYFLLAGQEPFVDESSSSVFEKVLAGKYPSIKQLRGTDVPSEVETLVFQCMHFDPSRRPLSADVLASDAYALAERLSE